MSLQAMLAGLAGLVVGGLLHGAGGTVGGALLGYLLATVVDLQQRITAIEQRARAAARPQSRPHQEPAPPAAAERPETPAATTAPPGPLPPPAESTSTPRSKPRGRTLERLRRLLLGGNLPVRLGVVVLFFGVAFLLKFAAERAVLPIELRLTAVALGGIALLAVGWRLRHRHLGYGLVLQGGGVGVLYLTTFAAMRLYPLLPVQWGFGLLVVLVALSSLLAVLQNSMVLAVLGVSGGFLAPVLASTGGGSHVALFGYYALLNTGIFGIAYFRAWRPLNVVGFVFTFVIGTAWGLGAYRPELFASTEPFLVLFFLMYTGIAVLFALRQPPRLRGYVDGTLVFGTPIAAFGLQAALVYGMPYALAWSAIAVAALYIGLASLLWRRTPALRPLAEAFLALGLAFASVAVPLALTGHWTAATWALEGAALLWVGVRQQRLLPRLAGLLLQLGAGLALLWRGIGTAASQPALGSDLLAGLCLALAGLFSAWYLQRHRDVLRDWERDFHLLPYLWGLLWWTGSLGREIDRAVPVAWQLTALLLAAAGSALTALYSGSRLHWPLLRRTALILLPLLSLFALAAVVDRAHPLMDGGWLAWPLALAAYYRLLFQLEQDVPPPFIASCHAAGVWLLAWLIGAESAYWLDRAAAGAGTWSLIGWALPSLLAVFILASPPQRHWPFAAHGAAYARLGLTPLIGALGLWLAYANLTSRGDPAPLPYLPLLNPLDLVQAFVLLAVIRWWRRLTPPLFDARIAAGLAGAAGFLWLNAMLVRSVHHWAEVAFALRPMAASTVFQSSLSLLWSALALICMGVASRLRLREAWFVGGALMAAVVAKLFLIDLDGSDTVARIVSFLGVGVLLLIIGYLAPLPPARTEARA